MELSIQKIVDVTGGKILRKNKESFSTYGIDSRKMHNGGLFFALKGTQTDGHLFLNAAFRSGAEGAVVERHESNMDADGTLILVKDSLQALQDLAAAVRNESKAKFIGITGSSGKTSTKEFIAKLLAAKYSVYKTEGNLNSLTGLPLSLLAMNQEERGVFEVGMNQRGELASLAALLKPDIAVLLNVNPVHLGYFSSLEEIAHEKATLADHLSSSDSSVVYNADDALLAPLVSYKKGQHVAFGIAPEADLRIVDPQLRGVRGVSMKLQWKKELLQIETSLCGLGNAYNIAAAACVGLLDRIDSKEIEDAVRALTPYTQRGVLLDLNGILVYDDSYNSNPKALEIALRIVASTPDIKRKVAVIGDMLELGPNEAEFHSQAGRLAADLRYDILITAGQLSQHAAEAAKASGLAAVYHTENSSEAAEKAELVLSKGDLVLVKGSRGMKMENVIERLRSR